MPTLRLVKHGITKSMLNPMPDWWLTGNETTTGQGPHTVAINPWKLGLSHTVNHIKHRRVFHSYDLFVRTFSCLFEEIATPKTHLKYLFIHFTNSKTISAADAVAWSLICDNSAIHWLYAVNCHIIIAPFEGNELKISLSIVVNLDIACRQIFSFEF